MNSGTENSIMWPGWKTVRLIGRGSFGAVYEIERDVLDEKEKAALKVITLPQNSSDISEMYSDGYDEESITSIFKEHLKSIIAEYSLMRKLNGSANVVSCDDVRYLQHDDGVGWDIFIKMELLTPLTASLPEVISDDLVIKIGKDICHALVQCKQFGIIHRDIKPQNIFVSPLGDYKLGDFGIAKTVEKTCGGTKIGTYKYMAPEVYNNRPYGAGADLYSLGLVLYWLLNEKRLPFLPLPPEKLRAGLEEQARMRRFNGESLPPPAHGSNALKQIVLKACAYDPKMRYQSADEMLYALETMGNSNASFVSTQPNPESTPVEQVYSSASIPSARKPSASYEKQVYSPPQAPQEVYSSTVASDYASKGKKWILPVLVAIMAVIILVSLPKSNSSASSSSVSSNSSHSSSYEIITTPKPTPKPRTEAPAYTPAPATPSTNITPTQRVDPVSEIISSQFSFLGSSPSSSDLDYLEKKTGTTITRPTANQLLGSYELRYVCSEGGNCIYYFWYPRANDKYIMVSTIGDGTPLIVLGKKDYMLCVTFWINDRIKYGWVSETLTTESAPG